MPIKAVISDLFGTLVLDKMSFEKYPHFLSRLVFLLNV